MKTTGISLVSPIGNFCCRATVGNDDVHFPFHVAFSDGAEFVVGFNVGDIQLKIFALYVPSLG